MATRIDFNVGYAEFDDFDFELVGDRALPRTVNVHFSGAGGQPSLDLVLALRDGAPECRELHLISHEDGRAVRPLDLDAIRLRDWVDDVYAACAMPARTDKSGKSTVLSVPGSGDTLQTLSGFAETRKGKGARRLTDALLREAAEVYRANIDDKPIRKVAAHFGVSERSASSYITKARDPAVGLLPPTTRGKKQA